MRVITQREHTVHKLYDICYTQITFKIVCFVQTSCTSVTFCQVFISDYYCVRTEKKVRNQKAIKGASSHCFKKCDGKNVSTYTGIFLITEVDKLCNIEQNITSLIRINLRKEQYAFMESRSTTNLIFGLCQLIQKRYQWNKVLWFDFLHTKNAFDLANRKKTVWPILNSTGVSNNTVKRIEYREVDSLMASLK